MRILWKAYGRLMHDSVPISLCIGVRADVRGDSQRGDWRDVAGHPGEQLAMLVHGRACIPTACVLAPLTYLNFVVQYEWFRTGERIVFALGTRIQWALVIAGSVRTVARAAVPGSATSTIIRTCGGPGGDHPRVRRSRANFAHDGVAGTVNAGRSTLTSVSQFQYFFLW